MEDGKILDISTHLTASSSNAVFYVDVISLRNCICLHLVLVGCRFFRFCRVANSTTLQFPRYSAYSTRNPMPQIWATTKGIAPHVLSPMAQKFYCNKIRLVSGPVLDAALSMKALPLPELLWTLTNTEFR